MKSDKNQIVELQSTYILIKLDYSSKFILPAEDAFKFLNIWGKAIHLKSGYTAPHRIKKKDSADEISITFLSEQEVKEIQMASLLDQDEKED